MTVIESPRNGMLRHFIRLGQEKKYRRSSGEMLCEGAKMLEEALSSGVEVRTMLMRLPPDPALTGLLHRAEQAGARMYAAVSPLFAQASGVETPQSVIFSCVPPASGPDALAHAVRVLLLDGVQDPGNLGTILRTADAFALDAVVLCEGCADPTAPKVVRATMGAIFRLPLVRLPLQTAVAALRKNGLPLYAAALTNDAVPVDAVSLRRCAVIVGSEGHGVSETALALSDRRIVLPMRGCAESLNAGVAASILMWEMSKEKRE